jgi:hypothetical protein
MKVMYTGESAVGDSFTVFAWQNQTRADKFHFVVEQYGKENKENKDKIVFFADLTFGQEALGREVLSIGSRL